MHKKPINTKILLTILVFVSTLIPSCVASSLYYFTEHRSLTRQAMNYEQQFLTDMERSFSDFEERLEKIQYEITSQFVTTNMYQINITQLKEGQIRNIRTMENLLQSIRRTFPGVNNIYIIIIRYTRFRDISSVITKPQCFTEGLVCKISYHIRIYNLIACYLCVLINLTECII